MISAWLKGMPFYNCYPPYPGFIVGIIFHCSNEKPNLPPKRDTHRYNEKATLVGMLEVEADTPF